MPEEHLRPFFIVLEGIDGCGSTTQGDRLTSWLRSLDLQVHFTHEPSNGPSGMLIRLALSRRLRGSSGEYHAKDAETIHPPSDLDPYTLALLYASDRMDHAANEIIPNLRYGRIVICDRYLMSTLAYQGLSVDEEWLFQINRFAPIPDLCIYFDLPVEYAKDRMQRTRWTRDLYEEENKLRQIRERYLRLVSNPRPEIGPILLVDATQRIEIVGKKVRKAIEPFLGQSETQKSKVNLSLFEWPKE